MFRHKIKWFQIIKIIFVILIIAAIIKLVLPIFNTEEFRELVERAGIWGPVIFILYCITAHVIAPLVGSPIFLVNIAIYGVARTVVYYYIASLISCTINFYISRKLGRPWVEKLGGKKTVKQVDKIVDKLGTKILIFCRILGWSLFDVISYAAGFTKLSFKRYFAITALFSILPATVVVLIFHNMEISRQMILYYIAMVAIIGGIFALVMRRVLRKD